jgi:hypothetical protein
LARSQGIAVDHRTCERCEITDGVIGLGELRRLHVEHVRQHDVAILGDVEPEHRIVAQTDIVKPDRQHHHGHRRHQRRFGDDQVAGGKNILAPARGKQIIILLAHGDPRPLARRARRFVKRLHVNPDLAHRLGSDCRQRKK